MHAPLWSYALALSCNKEMQIALVLVAFKTVIEKTSFSQIQELISLLENRFGYAVMYPNILFSLKKLGWSHKFFFLYIFACKLSRCWI